MKLIEAELGAFTGTCKWIGSASKAWQTQYSVTILLWALFLPTIQLALKISIQSLISMKTLLQSLLHSRINSLKKLNLFDIFCEIFLLCPLIVVYWFRMKFRTRLEKRVFSLKSYERRILIEKKGLESNQFRGFEVFSVIRGLVSVWDASQGFTLPAFGPTKFRLIYYQLKGTSIPT